MRLTRDSLSLWLASVIAVLGYLAASKPPTEWSYAEWIQAMTFVMVWISGKLAASPLRGEFDGRK